MDGHLFLRQSREMGSLNEGRVGGFLSCFCCLYDKNEFGIFNSFEGNVSAFGGTVGTLAVRM